MFNSKDTILDAIFIFDTQESAQFAASSGRDTKIRAELGEHLEIRSTIVKLEENLQDIVPEKMAGIIREFGLDNVIVDLSNGQKITASVLYAVSTISRIQHIYSLEFVNRPPQNRELKDLEPNDWKYSRTQPLKEILNITQSSYVELIYYRDRIQKITADIEGKNREFGVDTRNRLDHSLLDYFTLSSLTATQNNQNISQTGRYESCINGLGKICEDIARIWYEYGFQTGLITKEVNTFNGYVDQIVSRWSEFRKQVADDTLEKNYAAIMETIKQAVMPTFVIDVQLRAMQTYRNLASHAHRHYEYDKNDTRLALDLTLLILEKLVITPIFTRPILNNIMGTTTVASPITAGLPKTTP
jgi:hypothetical protein